jgi:aminopeptidase
MTYVPRNEHLERYAELLVGFALGSGEGIAPGDVVQISAPEAAKPLYAELSRAVWRAGGHVIGRFRPDDDPTTNLSRDFFEIASDEQLDFLGERHWKGLVEEIDHSIHVLAERDPHALRDVDPARILRSQRARRKVNEWLDEKEGQGRFTWTIGLYGTEAMAAEARMSIEEYWEQIVAACFLDLPDPAARWRQVGEQIDAHCAALNAMPIDRLHVEGEDADLWIKLGEKRRWLGGGGRNIPSFEVFTSPDWRGTEGWIRFSEPLYVYGSLITGVELEFRNGHVVSAKASENEALLGEMIASENADKVGEFSLTDCRLSPISRFMANTLFDENTGGPYGNTHVALGLALRPCYAGDPSTVSEEEWGRLGFNASAVHTDIVSTTDRTVTATMDDGSEQVIYADGRFVHGS